MPSAFTQNFYHTVFSSKQRANLIVPDLEARLYPFMGGILSDLRCTLLAINGMPDQIHLLVRPPGEKNWRSVIAREACLVFIEAPALSLFA